jgi:hypothetical protein
VRLWKYDVVKYSVCAGLLCALLGNGAGTERSVLERKSPATIARIGQTVRVDGPRVRPVSIVEDSRCPKGVECLWAGQVRIRVLVMTSSSRYVKEMTLGGSVQVADGALSFVSVTPERVAGRAFKRRDYRFGFTFSGGL